MRADQPMQLVLNHKRLDLWNVDHLMAVRFWILSAVRLPAPATGTGQMGDNPRALLRGEEVAAGAGMPVLVAALEATALAFLVDWGLETLAITGWRL
jgi:hypothetical protein